MKTLNVNLLAAAIALPGSPARPVGTPCGNAGTANTGAAIDRQLDEIQRTFGVRWEW